MGTRGVFGVRKRGIDKLVYNHYDSYPEGLGLQVCKNIEKIGSIKSIDDKFDDLIPFVSKYFKTEGKEIRSFNDDFINMNWSEHKVYFEIDNDFITDSLMCEWGYIINLDSQMLEIWRGFATEKNEENRYFRHDVNYYETREGEVYYPCELILEIPLQDVVDGNYGSALESII